MLALFTLFFASNAYAYTYWGNPELSVHMDRDEADLVDGTATLGSVVVHACAGGSTTYTRNQVIDPVAGTRFTITGGDLCAVDLVWTTDVEVDGDTFTLASSSAVDTVTLVGTTSTADWVPFSVVSGQFSGSHPEWVVTID